MSTSQLGNSFEEFRQSCGKRALSFALRLTRNRDDAEDLVQDALLRAFRAYDPTGDRKPSEAWLKQIVFNCFVDNRRRANRRPSTYSIDWIQEQNHHFDVEDGRPTAAELLQNEALSEKIEAALKLLTEKQRTLVLHVLYGDLTYTELSEIYGIRPQTLKTRLHRAHMNLRRQLTILNYQESPDVIIGDHKPKVLKRYKRYNAIIRPLTNNNRKQPKKKRSLSVSKKTQSNLVERKPHSKRSLKPGKKRKASSFIGPKGLFATVNQLSEAVCAYDETIGSTAEVSAMINSGRKSRRKNYHSLEDNLRQVIVDLIYQRVENDERRAHHWVRVLTVEFPPNVSTPNYLYLL